MGFKCSVFGHRFEEPGLVNEREKRGEEVINVNRKVMECSICGEKRVLAERKEITKGTNNKSDRNSNESSESEGGGEEVDDGPPPGGDRSGASSFAGIDVVNGDSAIGPSPDENSWHPTAGTEREQAATEESLTAATDDGEILASTSSSTSGASSEEMPDLEPTDSTDETAVIMDETYACSTCGFSVHAPDSPFRAGDICPQCHDAYLTEVTDGTQ